MKRIQIKQFDYIQIISLFFVPVFFAYLLYLLIPIQNKDFLSIVSATASINALIWILVIAQILFNYALIKKYSIKLIVQINLVLILIYVSTFKVLIKALSLKGTPLPSTDIRGDLLNVVNLAKIAQEEYWAGGPNSVFPDGGYPPIWPSLIGNVARIFNVHVLDVFKPAEFVLMIVSPIFILYIWRLVMDSWMALAVTINQSLVYTYFDYKSLTLNLIIPLLIYIVMTLKSASKYKFFIYGLSFGLISLTYFGYIYWLIPLMIIFMITLLFLDNKFENFTKHTYLYLGLGAGLGPVVYFRITDNLILYYSAIILCLLLIQFLDKSMLGKRLFLVFFNIGLFLGLFGALLFFRTKDTWVEGGIERNDPTGGAIVSLNGLNLFVFLILMIALLFIIKAKENTTTITILAGIFASSTLFMYFIASQMQITLRVDLWPRAREVQSYALNLVFLVIFLFFISSILKDSKFKAFFEIGKQNTFYFISILIFVSGSYLVSTLGSLTYGSMPIHSFGGAWFAHQGCTNPHEDPMLSKVFENYPDIQEFLRKNCPAADWPEIPKNS